MIEILFIQNSGIFIQLYGKCMQLYGILLNHTEKAVK